MSYTITAQATAQNQSNGVYIQRYAPFEDTEESHSDSLFLRLLIFSSCFFGTRSLVIDERWPARRRLISFQFINLSMLFIEFRLKMGKHGYNYSCHSRQ